MTGLHVTGRLNPRSDDGRTVRDEEDDKATALEAGAVDPEYLDRMSAMKATNAVLCIAILISVLVGIAAAQTSPRAGNDGWIGMFDGATLTG